MMRHRICSPHLVRWLSLVTLVALLAGCGRHVRLPEPINAATIAPYPGNSEPSLLVDASWLKERQTTNVTDLVILDASDLATYRKGHISGAVHAWWQDTMDPNGAVYGTVLKPDNNEPD